jgi:hypothetical protein
VTGVIRNQSDKVLQRPAIVLGASAQVLPGDLAPGAEAKVDMRLEPNPFNVSQLSERIVGPAFFDNGGTFDADSQRKSVRRAIIDQLTQDPATQTSNQFAGDSAMLLAWGTDPIVPVEVEGQKSRRVGNVLYELPVPLAVSGTTVFRSDLIRTSVVEVSANFFQKDPWMISFGQGSARIAYRPIPFDGRFTASQVVVGLNFGGDVGVEGLEPTTIEPLKPVICNQKDPGGCKPEPNPDGLPEVAIRDRRTGDFVAFPHLDQGRVYALKEPTRWVDPATGEIEAKFTNDRSDTVSFQFTVQLEGDVS